MDRLTDLLSSAWEWLGAHPDLVWGVSGASAALLLVGFLALPIILVRLPADYFVRRPYDDGGARGAGRLVLKILRNLLGAVVLLAGIAMLALPGQGLLTVLAGLLLLDFPRKQELTLKLARREGIRRWIDWIRERGGAAPLVLPEGE